MGKKRQKDKGPREDDEDIDLTGPSCSHIRKGIDRSFLKKTGGESSPSTCQDCSDEDQPTGEDRDPPTIWMCLKCGHRGCGRNSDNQHAIKHFEKPRSDPHCLVVNMDSWSVWCYICDDDVQYSRTGNLAQLVTNVKKQASSEPAKTAPQKNVKVANNPVEEAEEMKTEVVEDPEEKEDKEMVVNPKKRGKKESVVKQGATGGSSAVKGLSNLGNTCFFNAVVQNLSQTQLLRRILNRLVEEEPSLTIAPGISSDREPILVQLERPGSLTLAMCQLLNEIQETKKGVVAPRELFTQVCKKAARFKGFQQQDSQELLRYLLDGMRTEEMKRVRCGISEALKKSGEDAELTNTLSKEYEKNGVPKNFVDQVFGGEMTSTVMCQQCKTVSSVTDMFLDLSLPVSDEAYRKKNQRKGPPEAGEESREAREAPGQLTNGGDDASGGAGSKYQQKKAKKQAKKQAKSQRRQQKVEGKPTLDDLITASTPADRAEAGEEAENGTLAEHQPAEADDQEHDPEPASGDERSKSGADDQEHDPEPAGGDERSKSGADDQERDPEPAGGDERSKSGADDQEHDPEPAGGDERSKSEEDEDSAVDCEPSHAPAVGNRFTALSEGRHAEDGLLEDQHPSEVVRDGEDGPSKPTEAEDGLAEGLENMSLDTAFITEPEGSEAEAEGGDAAAEAKEYTVVDRDPELVFHTLATRSAPEKQESSVQSCLFQFTEVESLTQNNSLLCVTCTKRQPSGKTSEGPKKNVYTDALKQMLISSAPPVLTLHLKRFQQVAYSVCKVNRHVSFPQILDVAPFCTVNCKSVAEGERQVLYSLYGIVEHSGTMRSGHYTAYVKTPPRCPSAMQNGDASPGEAETSSGSWFHVSDSSVHPVTERQAQSSQAYLLFYERIS